MTEPATDGLLSQQPEKTPGGIRNQVVLFAILGAICAAWDLWSKSYVFGKLGFPGHASDPYLEG